MTDGPIGPLQAEARIIAAMLEEAHVGLKDALAGRGDPKDRNPTRLRPAVERCLQGVTSIAANLGVRLPREGALPEFAETENDVLGAATVMARAVNRLARELGADRQDHARLLADAWLGLTFFAQHHLNLGPVEFRGGAFGTVGVTCPECRAPIKIRLTADGMRDQLVSYVMKPAEGGMFPARSLAAHLAALADALETTGAADAGVPVTALVQRVESRPDGAFAIDILCVRRRIQPPDPPRAAPGAPPVYPAVDDPEIVAQARRYF